MINNEVVSKGRKCRHCGDVAADLTLTMCMNCSHDYDHNDPVCGFDADGLIVEIDGKAVSPTKELPPLASAPVVPAAPVVPPPPPTVAPAPATDDKTVTAGDTTVVAPVTTEPAPAAEPATPATTVTATKKAYIEVVVDESPRETRPDVTDKTYAAAPKSIPAAYDLTEKLYPFGRENQLNAANFLLIEGDNAVSRMQGYLRRLPDGSYELQNVSENFLPWVRVKNIEIGKGQSYKLSDGDEIEMGDWFTITYHEQAI
jgi:hypothetical protein